MPKVKAIEVSAKRDGFRRGGIAWKKEPTIVPVSSISKENLKLIRSEKLLQVKDVEIDVEASAADKSAADKSAADKAAADKSAADKAAADKAAADKAAADKAAADKSAADKAAADKAAADKKKK